VQQNIWQQDKKQAEEKDGKEVRDPSGSTGSYSVLLP